MCHTVIIYLAFPTFFEGISQNRYLYKWKSLLKKFHIFPFIVILKKNSFWREFWVEKVTVLRSDANVELCQTSVMELLCKYSQQLTTVIYFCKKLHHRCLTGFKMRLWWWLLLDTERAFPIKQKLCLEYLLKWRNIYSWQWKYLLIQMTKDNEKKNLLAWKIKNQTENWRHEYLDKA